LGFSFLIQSFWVQLKGVSFEEVQKQLAKAPFGYNLNGRTQLSDWRSWEAFFNKTYSLASIDLQQRFPTTMYVQLWFTTSRRLGFNLIFTAASNGFLILPGHAASEIVIFAHTMHEGSKLFYVPVISCAKFC
jgi:hypothetical protein